MLFDEVCVGIDDLRMSIGEDWEGIELIDVMLVISAVLELGRDGIKLCGGLNHPEAHEIGECEIHRYQVGTGLPHRVK
jgi:hypothetical protein